MGGVKSSHVILSCGTIFPNWKELGADCAQNSNHVRECFDEDFGVIVPHMSSFGGL